MKPTGQMGMILTLLATGVLVALGTAQFYGETARRKPVVPPYELFWCKEDADCAVVDQIGCCPCSEGGGQWAVSTWHRDDLRRFLKSACRHRGAQVCVQIDTCSREAEARCIERRCKLVHVSGTKKGEGG